MLTRILFLPTFVGAADEFHSIELSHSAGLEDGEALEFHASVCTGSLGSVIPVVKTHAFGVSVLVVKQAVLGDQEGVGLESANCKQGNTCERMNIKRSSSSSY